MRLKTLTPLLLLALTLAACEESEIKQYKVAKVNSDAAESTTVDPAEPQPGPRNATPQAAPGGAPNAPFANQGQGNMPHPGGPAAGGQQQMLAAIVPHPQRTWFFKMMGPAAKVGPLEDKFNQLIDSVKIDASGETAQWDLPEGWHQHAGQGMRFATIMAGAHGSNPLELTVIPLGPAASGELANINRWRGQLGLPPIDQQQLDAVTRKVELDGTTATVVNILGAEPKQTAEPPADDSPVDATSAAKTTSGPITHTLPAGWTDQPAEGMRKVSIQAGEADLSVIALPPIAADVVANVNRWRGQVGLPQASAEEIQKQAQAVMIDGSRAVYVDLAGPESAGAERQRIVAAMSQRDDQVWFFKMSGSFDAVQPQVDAFKRWLDTLRFN